MNIIQEIDREQMQVITNERRMPVFGPGDTLKVMVKVIEGETTRLQAYEGMCIARSGGGINESFTVRKISYGEGVERVFPIYSPYVAEVEVLRRGKVRRAKLYYLRGRRGKAARIFERTDARAKKLSQAFKSFKRPKGNPDDLSQLRGVTPELVKQLATIGVIKFEQIANFSDDDIANADEALKLGGAIERGDWATQARELIAAATVGEATAEEKKA